MQEEDVDIALFVSVPLSGLSFLISLLTVNNSVVERFRPLIGVIISNKMEQLLSAFLDLFPSPYRGYHF